MFSSKMETYEVKKKLLFECLNDAEKCLKGTQLDQSYKRINTREIGVIAGTPEKKLAKLCGKESIFVKPNLPITKCLKPRQQPDFKINPHKWKKYSLEDADISDKTNSAAAHAFLKEISAQKQSEDELAEDDDNNKKLVFHKPLRVSAEQETISNDDLKPKLKGSKLVMPEYVVGQMPTKIKKVQSEGSNTRRKAQSVKLEHLFDE